MRTTFCRVFAERPTGAGNGGSGTDSANTPAPNIDARPMKTASPSLRPGGNRSPILDDMEIERKARK